MRVLVLSGGAEKGSGQAGAAYHLKNMGWEWDYVIGTSVGSLNGAMIAQGKWDSLQQIWDEIKDKNVYTSKLTPVRSAMRLLVGKSSLLGTDPLRRMIDHHVNLEKFILPLDVSYVELDTGEVWYASSRTALENEFKRCILASASMPVIFPNVHRMGYSLVDGGIRDTVPLGRAFSLNPTHITVVTTHRPLERFFDGGSMIDTAGRSLGIMLDEITRNDIETTLELNHLAAQAKEHGIPLLKRNGFELKNVKIDIVHPSMPYSGGLLDFSDRSWHIGERSAAAFLRDRGSMSQMI